MYNLVNLEVNKQQRLLALASSMDSNVCMRRKRLGSTWRATLTKKPRWQQ